MQSAMITIAEAAELESIGINGMYKNIYRNNLTAVKIEKNGVCEYRIELNELSEKAKRKYYSRQEKLANPYQEKKEPVDLETLTSRQRQEVVLWEIIINEYEAYINGRWKEKTNLTNEFVRMYNITHAKQISARTLYRKMELVKELGAGGLADQRKQSHRKGETQIPEIAWAIFEQWWLDEARPAVTTVYRMLKSYCELDMPELLEQLPTQQTFYNKSRKIDYAAIQYFRHGNKAFEDACQPYIRRTYEDIDSNDVWSSDYHTLDAFVKDDVTGKVFRPHIAAWIDVRSRKILAIVLCENSTSEGVILAFRKAVMEYGVPLKVYLDNGREFLVHDFGGRGKRKTDENADYGTNILDRLGITMHNATVKNAKTKIIERTFREVKNEFSKLLNTFCGGTPEERPERLEKILKKDSNVPLLSEVRRQLEAFCFGGYNERGSKAVGMAGACPNQVYEDKLIRKRTAKEEMLNLLMLRSTRLQKVGRNGVSLRFGDTVLDYYDTALLTDYENKKVYIRYDTEHLATVRIYDDQERFICVAKLRQTGGYALGEDTNLEAIKELNHIKKEKRQAVLSNMEEQIKKFPAPEMLDVMERAAKKKMDEITREYKATIIEPLEFEENTYSYLEEDKVEIDLAKMAANASKGKQ